MLWPLVLLLAQSAGTLDLHLTSAGKPTAARVYILDPSGHPLRIPGAVIYSRRGETTSYVDGNAAFPLHPGKYQLRAEKGLEYRKAAQDVEIHSNQTAQVTLDLPHLFNMNAQGWYSGDLHNHRSPADMPLVARAEDLNISPIITRHVGGPNRQTVPPFPAQNLIEVDATHIVSLHNQEVERLYQGHGAIDLLNASTPVAVPQFDLFPMDVEYCRQARRDRAFCDAEKPIWKNTPVDVAFGMVDAIGVVNNHFHPDEVMTDAEKYGSMPQDKPEYKTPAGFAQWVMNLYYSFLNCGFQLPVSAGSASGVMNSWPGYERVYVHLDGPFSYENWFHALKLGQSFATNGPILLVTANGQLPGTEFEWKKPMAVKLSIEAQSQDPIDRIEIVQDGEVTRTIRGELRTTINLKLDHPGWLAVRCFEPAGVTVRYAHTTPFWFVHDEHLPVHKADAQRWAAYVDELAASVKTEQYPSQVDYDKALETFHMAAQIYRTLAQRGQ